MDRGVISKKSFCVLSGLSGIVGVILILLSFNINAGPPPGATNPELIKFGEQHYTSVLWGAWLQAVGPLLIVLFAFSLVHLAGATQRLSGWMTFFGATTLMTVSLIEITFYISALHADPAMMSSISLVVISAVQHLYFIVAAPTLFLPLGLVLLSSPLLPRIFGYLALLLGMTFAILGVTFLTHLTLPGPVTAFAGIQAFWWLAAVLTLVVRSRRIADSLETKNVSCRGRSSLNPCSLAIRSF